MAEIGIFRGRITGQSSTPLFGAFFPKLGQFETCSVKNRNFKKCQLESTFYIHLIHRSTCFIDLRVSPAPHGGEYFQVRDAYFFLLSFSCIVFEWMVYQTR